jgi:hypothetical protein
MFRAVIDFSQLLLYQNGYSIKYLQARMLELIQRNVGRMQVTTYLDINKSKRVPRSINITVLFTNAIEGSSEGDFKP